MSTQTALQNLRGFVTRPFQTAETGERCDAPCHVAPARLIGLRDIPLEQIAGSLDGAEPASTRFDLLSLLFTDHDRAQYRRLESDDLTPIRVVQHDGSYYAVSSRDLAAARYTGKAFVLAELWE